MYERLYNVHVVYVCTCTYVFAHQLSLVLFLTHTCTLAQMTNKTTAKRNIDSVSRAYMNAKRASSELENCTRGLIRGGTSVPLQGTPQEMHQVQYHGGWGARNKRGSMVIFLHPAKDLEAVHCLGEEQSHQDREQCSVGQER